jgi:hypothetical protein
MNARHACEALTLVKARASTTTRCRELSMLAATPLCGEALRATPPKKERDRFGILVR